MNKKCNIARDLMPLVIDKAASEDSGEFVFDHIAACAECRAQYEEMKKEPDSPAIDHDDSAFANSVQKLKKKQKTKKVLVSVLCVFLAFCMAFAGIEIYNGYLINNVILKPFEELDVRLYSLPSGVVQIYMRDKEIEPTISFMAAHSPKDENGEISLYIELLEPKYPSLERDSIRHPYMVYGEDSYQKLQLIDGELYDISVLFTEHNIKTEEAADSSGIKHTLRWKAPRKIGKIYYGDPSKPDSLVLLYKSGDEIEMISEKDFAEMHNPEMVGESTIFLPDDFYNNASYERSLAEAWARGENPPAIPRKYLPVIASMPDSVEQKEQAFLQVLLVDSYEYPEGFVSGYDGEIIFEEHYAMTTFTIPLEIDDTP